MDDCKISGSEGQPVPGDTDERIQALWNKVLDECAEKQQQQRGGSIEQPTAMISSDDFRTETSGEYRSEESLSSNAESEATEAVMVSGNHGGKPSLDRASDVTSTETLGEENRDGSFDQAPYLTGKGKVSGEGRTEFEDRVRGSSVTALQTPASLGRVLEETARTHLASFSRAEQELWGWHRGNLEISCGAVSVF